MFSPVCVIYSLARRNVQPAGRSSKETRLSSGIGQVNARPLWQLHSALSRHPTILAVGLSLSDCSRVTIYVKRILAILVSPPCAGRADGRMCPEEKRKKKKKRGGRDRLERAYPRPSVARARDLYLRAFPGASCEPFLRLPPDYRDRDEARPE